MPIKRVIDEDTDSSGADRKRDSLNRERRVVENELSARS